MRGYITGHLNLLSQWAGWLIKYTENGNESISAASWRRAGPERDTSNNPHARFYRFINRLFFKQENHCAEAVWNDVAWCREYLEMPGIDHMVLNQQEAAEYKQWREAHPITEHRNGY